MLLLPRLPLPLWLPMQLPLPPLRQALMWPPTALRLPRLVALSVTLGPRGDDEDDDDDDNRSLGDEDQSSEVKKRAESSRRARWTTVEQLRRDETATME
jgi:hypothetical protein